MSLLLLFAGGGGGGIDTYETLITTAPIASHGYPIQLEAVSGQWRFCVELADPTGDLEWLDLTRFYLGDRHQLGADQPKGRYVSPVTRVDLQIDAQLADTLGVDINILAPWGQDTTDLFGVNVTLDAGLFMRAAVFRVVAAATVEWYPLWTGRVESWGDDSRARGQIRTHVINVVGFQSDMANVPTIVDAEADWEDWFTDQLLPAANWQFGVDIYGQQPVATGLPQDLVPAAAINRMDAGADPLGLVWRTRRNGKLILYPAPWDTVNISGWDTNPLELAYPGGLVFSFAPDFTQVEYIADDDQQPFGVSRSIVGVLNTFAVTRPDTTVYAIDDPTSQARYGRRPFTATWIIDNDAVVDDLLADRAFASQQATPLRTTIDHEGFFPALALLDHLDPVTVIHATLEDQTTVTVVGVVRSIVEERTFRFYDGVTFGALSWQSTVQMDIDSTESAAALLPVENLALVSAFTPGFGGPSGAEFSWTNPTQPDVTPTALQVRILGRSPIWVDIAYPGVGADGLTAGFLAAETPYTFQVRIIRRVNGVVTHFSPTRSLDFITPANIVPFPVPDGEDTDAEIPGEPDGEECEDLEVELQSSSDGITWTTEDTFTGSELTPNGDGTFSLTTPIPNTFFDDDKVYRFRSSCDGVTWFVGPVFDPPDDWTDPCTTPPALSVAPFDEASLLVYVPQICAPDIIREAVSGIAGVHGDALAGFSVLADDPDYRALLAIDDPEWSDTPGGILAYGECPQITGETGDKTIAVRVSVANNDSCVLFECAGIQITAAPGSGSDWVAGATFYTVAGTVSLLSGDLDAATEYTIMATFDASTGDLELFVDGVSADADTSLAATTTINALPIWRVGAPPSSWITDCAVWNEVLVPAVTPPDISGMELWLDASDAATITSSVGLVSGWDDKSGNGHDFVAFGGERPTTGTRTQNSLNVLDFITDDLMSAAAPFWFDLGTNTMLVVFQCDGNPPGSLGHILYEGSSVDTDPLYGLRYDSTDTQAIYRDNAGTLHAAVNGDDPTDSAPHLLVWTDSTTVIATTQDSGTTHSSGSFTRGTTTVNALYIGALPGDSSGGARLNMDGWIAEILIYDRVLTTPEIDALTDYLTNKWGL